MAGGYVPIFYDWLEVTQDMTAEEKGNLIDAVVSYACGLEYEHFLSGGCRIAFRFMKGQVDRNAAISDARRKAREGKQTGTDSNKPEQSITNDNKQEQTPTKSQNKNDNKNNNKNDNNNNDIYEPQRRFTPPSLDDIALYCVQRGNHVIAQRFYDYYTTNGWRVGRAGKQMKDWKAAVRLWEKSEYTERDWQREREESGLPY